MTYVVLVNVLGGEADNRISIEDQVNLASAFRDPTEPLVSNISACVGMVIGVNDNKTKGKYEAKADRRP